MRGRWSGRLSLGWFAAAVAVGIVAMNQRAALAAWAYGAVAVCAPLLMVAVWCTKCAGRSCCAHVLPGKLAGRLSRGPGPYSAADYLLCGLAIALLLLVPQVALVRQPPLLALFWVLVVAGAVHVRRGACRVCANEHCPAHGAASPRVSGNPHPE